MDSTDNPNCKSPVAVKIASDAEPIECRGELTDTHDGFVLEFSDAQNKYTVTHKGSATAITATGLLSYALGFGCEGSSTVKTPMGDIDMEIFPMSCSARRVDDGAHLEFSYKLVFLGGEQLRNVKVDAVTV